ncbi:broad specificity phosphatase PhoE [Pseudomonas sp. TE3786]
MKATRLTLLAHAPTAAQKLGRFPVDEPIETLTPQQQATLTGAVGDFHGVLCAAELRTQQTAALFGGEWLLVPELQDYAMGDWQGQALKTLQADQPDALAQWLENSAIAPPGGESLEQLCARVGTWLDTFREPGHWLAITHPWVMRAALVHVLRCPPASAYPIDIEPLSMLQLSRYGQWRLRVSAGKQI